MKRAETVWQVMVLLLVVLMTIGVYLLLALALHRVRTVEEGAVPASTSWSEAGVQIVDPLDGAVLGRSQSVMVRAALLETGFVQAEFQVDGVGVALRVNPDPQAVPWIVQWEWEGVGEGSHLLAVRARRADDSLETSAPIRVTAVPEGTLLFASNRDGAYAIYTMKTNGRDRTRLTTGPGDALQAAAGPGATLAYVSQDQDGQTTVWTLDGHGEGQTMLLAGRDPAWSPDGLQLAYSASPEGLRQVFAVSTSGGSPLQVTNEEVYAGQPSWSPDATKLAYVAEHEGNLDIWVVALDGGDPQRLTHDPATDWAPAWSPDGSRLAFVSDREGSYQVYAMRADGSDVRRLTSLARGAEAPTWSPDGFWLAFVAYSGDGPGVQAREIWMMRADGQSQVRLTYDAFDDTEPDWAQGSWTRQ